MKQQPDLEKGEQEKAKFDNIINIHEKTVKTIEAVSNIVFHGYPNRNEVISKEVKDVIENLGKYEKSLQCIHTKLDFTPSQMNKITQQLKRNLNLALKIQADQKAILGVTEKQIKEFTIKAYKPEYFIYEPIKLGGKFSPRKH